MAEIERKENQLSTADSQLSTVNCQLSTVNRLQGFLSSQGGFVVDKFYADKVLDFAMEFFVHEDHTVEFLGWSVFHAGENGAYGYNYVESQEELLRRIDTDENLLLRLIEYHKEHLAKTAYHGPVGIDMMLYWDENGRIALNPCVEVNLRMTMGMVTAAMGSRHGLRGNFKINSTPSYQAILL